MLEQQVLGLLQSAVFCFLFLVLIFLTKIRKPLSELPRPPDGPPLCVFSKQKTTQVFQRVPQHTKVPSEGLCVPF